MDKNLYDEAYFEGRDSNYGWTVGGYQKIQKYPHWEEILRVIKQIKECGKLLDIGCAYGYLVSMASSHFESYGVDISKFAIKKSKEFGGRDILMASAVNLPFRKNSFDIITVLDTLEHVSKLSECIKDVRRVLKKGGILFLQLPNPLIERYFFGFFGLRDKTHVNNLLLKRWKTMLAKNKLKVEKCFGMFAFFFKGVRFFRKSEISAPFFPEWWIIAKK